MKQVADPKVWQDAVNYLVRGREESWSGERIDPREQGAEYAVQGRRKRDPYLLRQAALAFKSAGDELEAGRCIALALEYEGKLKDSGDRYRGLGLFEDAFRCYWEGQHFSPLCTLSATEPLFASRLESRAADFTTQGTSVQGVFLSEVIGASRDNAWRSDVARDPTWKLVIAKLGERVIKAVGDDSIPWRDVYEMFTGLAREGLKIDELHLALTAYKAEKFPDAVEIWERVGGTDRDEYRRAKALVAPFPDNLMWFHRLKDHKSVLKQWNTHGSAVQRIDDLPEAVFLAVVDAAVEESDLPLAAELLNDRPDRDRLAMLLAASVKKGDAASALAGSVIGARLLVAAQSWTAAIRAAEESDFSEIAKREAAELRTLLRKGDSATVVFRDVVEELAHSAALAKESGDRQGPVAEFLHRSFIGKDVTALRQQGLEPEVVGAAIERAGKIIDALQFYETVGRDPNASADLKRLAAERVVRINERYAEWFRGRGDERQARDRAARAKSGRDTLRIGKRQLPDYPVLRRRSVAAEPSEWSQGPFRFVISRPHGRLRIEHSERFETVTVYGHEAQLRGDAAFGVLDPTDDAVAAWRIPEWDMTIQLLSGSAGRSVTALFAGERFSVVLTRSEKE